jgi:hypothetical protein
VTQTFGLGMFRAPAAGDLDRIEAFFRARDLLFRVEW